MSINPERLYRAMNDIQNLLREAGYDSNSPVMALLREARAYAGGVRNLQSQYIQLAQEHLAKSQIFNYDRSNFNVAFDLDIKQYEKLIEYCLIANDYQLLEWGVSIHRQHVASQYFGKFYIPKLEQHQQSYCQELYQTNPEAANELNACYGYLIKLLAIP